MNMTDYVQELSIEDMTKAEAFRELVRYRRIYCSVRDILGSALYPDEDDGLAYRLEFLAEEAVARLREAGSIS